MGLSEDINGIQVNALWFDYLHKTLRDFSHRGHSVHFIHSWECFVFHRDILSKL